MPSSCTTVRQTRNVSRAAQYLRMSTEHQKYSTENQADTIRKYADEHGLEIVRTYRDDGKSGLLLRGRLALQQLVSDARNNACDFDHILIYDVSRWGRFQDVDEGAYYEFVCATAGLTVHYCAELFENDGSLLGSILKNIKRMMAAEFSRELSTKVFAGQCKLITHGYRQGGMAGLGLGRLLVDEHGNPKFLLKTGERKSILTDRVILVPGPPQEVALVRRIFGLYVFKNLSQREIAAILNSDGSGRASGRRWTHQSVRRVLENEKYIGNNVFNRQSQKLRQRVIKNPPEMWVRAEGCFEPIVERSLFLEAQRIRKERTEKLSNEVLLNRLRSTLAAKGCLSIAIIDEAHLGISARSYMRRFHGPRSLYELIGYRSEDPRTYGYDDQSLLDYLRRLLVKRGRLCKAIIDANKPGPDSKTYHCRFGGLRKAYQLIGYSPPTTLPPRGKRGRFRRSSADVSTLSVQREGEIRSRRRTQ